MSEYYQTKTFGLQPILTQIPSNYIVQQFTGYQAVFSPGTSSSGGIAQIVGVANVGLQPVEHGTFVQGSFEPSKQLKNTGSGSPISGRISGWA